MINPGKMDRLITIQKMVTDQDGTGSSTTTYQTREKVWAERVELSSNERVAAMSVKNKLQCKFRIHYNDRIEATDRIEDTDGTVYEILGNVEIGRKQGNLLMAGTL